MKPSSASTIDSPIRLRNFSVLEDVVLDLNGHLVIADTELQNMKGGHHAISSSVTITPCILSQLL